MIELFLKAIHQILLLGSEEEAEFRFRLQLFFYFFLSQSSYNRFFLSNLRRPIKLVLNSPTCLSGSGVYSVDVCCACVA